MIVLVSMRSIVACNFGTGTTNLSGFECVLSVHVILAVGQYPTSVLSEIRTHPVPCVNFLALSVVPSVVLDLSLACHNGLLSCVLAITLEIFKE